MIPRAIVEVAGVNVYWEDILDVKVENTLYLAADSFEITLDNTLLLSDWLRKLQEVKVYLGYVKDAQKWSKSELKHVFTGRIDGVKPKFGDSMTAQIIGRDYSAPLIDTEYSVAYAKRTSSQIAALLAKKYGLKPVITTTTLIAEKDLFTNKKEWEVLQVLADQEGFVCYVTKDKELYFGPRKDTDETVVADLYYRMGEKSNLLEVEFDDSSVGVINKVTVRHWLGRKDKRLIEASVQDDKIIAAMGGQVKERVVYESKAKTFDLAKQLAQKRLKEWARQVVTAQGQCEGNVDLLAEKKVRLAGCGRFSGVYYLEKVTHNYGTSGFVTDIDVTSLRPDSAEQYRQDLYDHKERKM